MDLRKPFTGPSGSVILNYQSVSSSNRDLRRNYPIPLVLGKPSSLINWMKKGMIKLLTMW
jgi:hypothetical protein